LYWGVKGGEKEDWKNSKVSNSRRGGKGGGGRTALLQTHLPSRKERGHTIMWFWIGRKEGGEEGGGSVKKGLMF